MSKEYTLAVVLLLGAVLKMFGKEIPNSTLEGLVLAVSTLAIAVFRYRKGDITLGGVKK